MFGRRKVEDDMRLATQRGGGMIMKYEDLTPEEKAEFDKTMNEVKENERKWFKDRGYGEADMMFADAEFKKYLEVEQRMSDNRPFDKAPGFRRIFMMGYFYGRASK